MLDQRQFQEWSRKLNFTTEAESLIQQIRSSAPSRRVQGRRGNVSGRYPSRKMGVTIQFESHRNELAAIYELEHDPAVIEMYDQPPAIKLNWETAAGKQVGIWHTPDYFVIRTDSAGCEECKEEKELLQLAENNPQRYQRDERGHWRCPPGEDYAGGFGLYYRSRLNFIDVELHPTKERVIPLLHNPQKACFVTLNEALKEIRKELNLPTL